MTPLSLTLGVFAAWWVVGLGILAAVRADASQLRIALTAPVVGSATTVIALFIVSHAGAGMAEGAIPVLSALFVLSLTSLAIRRPRVSRMVWPILAFCVVDLVLVGRPFFEFGFHWIGNANDDMANYVLSATDLLHHGLVGPVDIAGLRKDTDYASLLRVLHDHGSRPGADITLAALASLTRRPPYEVFMPLILAFNLCVICGTAALAAQASRRSWVPYSAGLLIVASPLEAYGTLQQLMPQVWGLALSTALFALLMREELHTSPGARMRDLAPIAILAVAFVLVYVELAASIIGAYALYVAVLALRRRIKWSAVARLWAVMALASVVVLNSYFGRELHYVVAQARGGVTLQGGASLFGFVLIPTELPAIVGIQLQDVGLATSFPNLSIVAAVIVLSVILVATLLTVRSGVGASCVLATYLVLGIYLATRSTDFGLFKLFMYVQPFLAAGIAVWLGRVRHRPIAAVAGAAVIALAVIQFHTEAAYVKRSDNPIDLTHASAFALLPTFRQWFAKATEPVIAVTENPVLAKLEAASVGAKPLYFISTYFFSAFISSQQAGWTRETIATPAGRPKLDRFIVNPTAERLMAKDHCLMVIPTGAETIVNREWLPEGSVDLVERRCGSERNLLVFTSSSLCQGFYLPTIRQDVSFYQLERDYFYPGHTFSGFGQFALFRVLNPTASVRLDVWLTTTLFQNGVNRIPPAVVAGSEEKLFPVVGRGSARVVSPALKPVIIGGEPYVLLDMGVPGELMVGSRKGAEGLYGRSIPVDPRYLTAYVRDISLLSNAQYERLRPPSTVSHFPGDLANPNLEYSGIYEDGWIAGDSYMVLAAGPAGNLAIRANVLPVKGQHLEVLVDGRRAISRRVGQGALQVNVPLVASTGRRRIELRWTKVAQLGPADRRKAAARLEFVGIVQAPSALEHPAAELSNPGVVHSGIFADGWMRRDAEVVLSHGPAATLVIRASVLSRTAGRPQHLAVIINGRTFASTSVRAGMLDLRVPVSASSSERRIQLRWAGTSRIGPDDPRRAAALLEALELVPRVRSR